jgi:hypothetical protein
MPTRRIALLGTFFWGVACLVAAFFFAPYTPARAGQKSPGSDYRILEPLRSGALTLFPVVRNGDESQAKKWDYITLDEGLRSGEVANNGGFG